MENFYEGVCMEGGFSMEGIFLCRSERFNLCKREKYALNE